MYAHIWIERDSPKSCEAHAPAPLCCLQQFPPSCNILISIQWDGAQKEYSSIAGRALGSVLFDLASMAFCYIELLSPLRLRLFCGSILLHRIPSSELRVEP
jgi:hypothetical protein